MVRSLRLRTALLVALASLLPASEATAQKFRADDPVAVDPDRLSIPRPGEIELSTSFDALHHSFGDQGEGLGIPAANINTLGEVPDSSWFENRIGHREMSIEELVRGANTTDGPDTSRPWIVIAGKSSGITPGFTIRDGRGDTYFLKFDPVKYPHLSTAADVIVAKFFYAFGYHVPENFIVHFGRDQLEMAPHAYLIKGHDRRPLTPESIDAILAGVPREPDGSVRAVASRAIPGSPVGNRLFYGIRGDDPNDIFRHEDRRELRGLRVFSAWLNHDDSRANNSLDTYVTEGDRSYVEHYLIDFSSTLGSGSDAQRRIAPQNPRAGNEYVIEFKPMWKTLFSLGLWERPWRQVEYDEHHEIGRLEAEFFQPHRWKPEYPNPAFVRMQPEDALWATKIMARLSEEAIAALVKTGEYRDVRAERLLTRAIVARQKKVLDYYLRQLSPLDEFEIGERTLSFAHLGERHGLGAVEGYDHEWFSYDNGSNTEASLGPAGSSEGASIPVPASQAEFLMVRIRARSGQTAWRQAVDVYLRKADPSWRVVGIDRETNGISE